jgi:dTDP-4-dehydrorhamnose reductase
VHRSAAAAGCQPLTASRAELDVTDPAAVRRTIAAARPDVVINCAAWTDVDGAESADEAALAVNGPGAGNVAAAARDAGAWTIQISSDYVFDGRKRGAYVESDAVGPLSAYGRSKLAGELAVAAVAPGQHTIVRTSWLFGANGRCFPKTMLRLAAERDHIDVVCDQVGCPTFTGHLADALVELAAAPVAGILHVAAAGHCSWWEFAGAIVAASRHDCEVRRITADQYPSPAPRPANSVLATERGAPSLPPWTEGLRAFMGQIAEVPA